MKSLLQCSGLWSSFGFGIEPLQPHLFLCPNFGFMYIFGPDWPTAQDRPKTTRKQIRVPHRCAASTASSPQHPRRVDKLGFPPPHPHLPPPSHRSSVDEEEADTPATMRRRIRPRSSDDEEEAAAPMTTTRRIRPPQHQRGGSGHPCGGEEATAPATTRSRRLTHPSTTSQR